MRAAGLLGRQAEVGIGCLGGGGGGKGTRVGGGD